MPILDSVDMNRDRPFNPWPQYAPCSFATQNNLIEIASLQVYWTSAILPFQFNADLVVDNLFDVT